MKTIIRLTESDLHNIVSNSVRRILREAEDPYYDNEEGYETESDFDHNGSNDIDEIIEDVCAQFGEGPVTIKGTLGLWDGKHEIQPVNCPDIMTAIQKCIGNDGEITRSSNISYDGDVVNLIVSHHDGQNIFKLYHAMG